MNGRTRVLALLDGRPADHLALMPITMMFAARRAGFRYGRYALDHRVLADAQLRTAGEFGFDHVSGITETREAPDCGAEVRFFDDQPWAIDESRARLVDKGEIDRLVIPDPLESRHMFDRILALRLMKERAGGDRIVEGWVEGPCGAAADLRGINRLMLDFYDDPPFVTRLLDFALELALRFGRAQLDAGADVVGIGDPAASLVGPRIYDEFVWDYEKRLTDGLKAMGARVRLHICGDTRRLLGSIARLGCDIVDVDSRVPVGEAREKLGPDQVILGGIDPVRVLQNGTPDAVEAAAAEAHRQAGSAFIVGAGCEVPPDTPPENLHRLARYARSHV